MRMTDISALGRSIDLSYPTNRAIAVLALVVAIAGAILRLLSDAALLDAALWGVAAGFALFLTWALGRELDPDHDLSAFVGAGLMFIGLLLLELPSLLVVFWLLLVLRVVNHTAGLPAKPLDSLAVLGFATWLTWQGYWMVGLVTAVAFLLDGLLSPPLRYHLFLSGLALVATVVFSTFHGVIATNSAPTVPIVISSLVLAGLFLFVIATSRESQAVGDATGKPLYPKRVQAGQLLALLTALLFSGWGWTSGVVALLPLWAAMIGVGLYRIAIQFRLRSR